MSERKTRDFHKLPISEYIFHHLRDERLGMEGDAVYLGEHLFEEEFKVERRGDGGEDDGIFDQLQSSTWGASTRYLFEYVCP